MNEKDLKKLKDLKFTITKEMENIIFEMLCIKQILDEKKLNKKNKKLLERHFKKLLIKFKRELHTYNPIQIQIINSYLDNKNEID